MVKVLKFVVFGLIYVINIAYPLNIVLNNKGKTEVIFSITSKEYQQILTLKPNDNGKKLVFPIITHQEIINIIIEDNINDLPEINGLNYIFSYYETLYIKQKNNNYADIFNKIKLFLNKKSICTIDTSKFIGYNIKGLTINYNSPNFDIELGAIGEMYMITVIKPDITNPDSGIYCNSILP